MELFKHTLYINLESRPDRLKHVETELAKMNITGERVNAIKTQDGAIGCSLSHIKSLELAKQRGYPYVFIAEDDITFLDPELLKKNMERFEKELNQHRWDVLVIGGK